MVISADARPWKVIYAGICLTASAIFASYSYAIPAPISDNPLAPQCIALGNTDFSSIPGAPTSLYAASFVDAEENNPAYCELEGFVAPQVGIKIRLPVENWNEKYLMVGCGGFCGHLNYIAACDEPLTRGYACITTDMGHKGSEAAGLDWAYNNPQAVTDFAYRATHVSAVAGKAIAESYYGKEPEYSYFSGCSAGGRQGLVEAQRFPDDFDGIIVGAPGISYTKFTMNFALRGQFLYDDDGKTIFDQESIKTISDAVIAKCDLNDGIEDGVIGDPRMCNFEPKDLACRSGSSENCLSEKQLSALDQFYATPTTDSGKRIGDFGVPVGTEGSFAGLVETPLTQPSFYEDFFKFMALMPNPGPSWTFDQFDVNNDYPRLAQLSALMDADNPDLRDFKAGGGKLLYYHGWGDGALSALTSIDYYEMVERTMGGRQQTEDFFRLFLIPGMDHCFGGNGATVIDYLTALENWVEKGEAPDKLIGSHFNANPMAPVAQGDKPKFTRPIYPYPMRTEYDGKGDPNSAESFISVKP